MNAATSSLLSATHISLCPLGDLRLDPRNPRQHSKRQIQQIGRSIKTFGFVVPILANSDGMILAGHGRYLAAQSLGLSEVPVIRLDHLTPEQARAFAIADNRLTETSQWDDQLLAQALAELAKADLDFDLDVTGFSMGEIDVRIDGLTLNADDKDPADQFVVSDQQPVTQAGDLWVLDEHRILCANSLESASYEILMQGKLAELVFTDAPYNVPIAGHVSGNGKTQHREFAMATGEMSQTEFTQFLATVMRLLVAHSSNGSVHYLCMDWRHSAEILAAGSQCYSELKNICVWAKDKGGMGTFYRSQHEFVLVYKNGTAPHRNNFELGQHGRYRTNVWNYPSASTLSRQGTEGDLLALHPTVKPIALVADAILDCSARGGIVLDVFLGSGTTLLAAHRVGRTCYGLEIDPLYVDTAIRRWQTMTGGQARLASTGITFDDRAAQFETKSAEGEVSHV